MLKELYKSQILELQQLQIIKIKTLYLKNVLHLLIV